MIITFSDQSINPAEISEITDIFENGNKFFYNVFLSGVVIQSPYFYTYGDAETSRNNLIADVDNNSTPDPIVASSKYFFQADQLEDPSNSDWVVPVLAEAVADSNNTGLIVRRLDDTIEEGLGFTVRTPIGATNIVLKIVSRAETSNSGNVVLKLYNRELLDNLAIESWSSGVNLTSIAMTSNEFWQYDSQTISLSSLNLVADRVVQFELTRIGTDGSDTLTGDWTFHSIEVSFT